MPRQEYGLAAQGMTAQDAVFYILDAASNYLDPESAIDTAHTKGVREGIEIALGAILSSDEEPAATVLAEHLEQDAGQEDQVIVVATYGGHDRSVEVYGPYNRRGVRHRLGVLRTQGVDVDDEHGTTMVEVTQLCS